MIVFVMLICLIVVLPFLIIGVSLGLLFLTSYIKDHKCPKCHKLGLIIKQTILVKPTYESPGTAEIEKRCRYCGYYEKNTITISKLSKFSSSGSSYSSFFIPAVVQAVTVALIVSGAATQVVVEQAVTGKI